MRARLAIGAVGLLVGGYGGWLLWSRRELADLLDAVLWLAGGVVAHDALLAPLVIGLALVAGRVVPGRLRAPLAALLVLLGSLTVLAVPVLGGFGRSYDPANTTVLDRDYGLGWLVVAATCLVVVGVGTWRGWWGGVRSDGREE